MRAFWLLLALLLPFVAPARAMESASVRDAHATVTLVSETDAYTPGHPFRVGLLFRLSPGWYTYWKNPGDAGAAAELHLTLPQGAAAGSVVWPAPARIPEGPLTVFGYHGQVLLPLTINPGASVNGDLPIRLQADWLVCEKICVPQQGSFQLNLPQGTAAPSKEAPLFAAADARTPRPSPFAVTVAPDGTLSVHGAGLTQSAVREAVFFPEASGVMDNAAPQKLSPADDGFTLHLTPGQGFKADAGLSGVLVIRDAAGQQSFLSVEARPGPASAPAANSLALAQAVLFALLAGLILNLMPCVFPILAMKALALARMSGADRTGIRLHAASYTGGVLLAFAALAAAMLGLRAAGAAAGWGFQFQSPPFVAAMAWLLFGVGLSFSGVFAPGSGWAGAGQRLAARSGYLGSFFAGLLAVMVATPCTAPFMGAAVAAALAAPAPVTVAIFLSMGLGLAAPYLLFALVPSLARLLPRPGGWMETLKQILAFPIYAASAWLVWVVSQQAGPDGVLATVAGLVLVGFAAWALGRAQHAGTRVRRGFRAAALAAVLMAVATLPGISGMAATAPISARAGEQVFSAARLAALRQENKPVFVDMTAAWCVTCLVNERVALDNAAVRQAFAQHGVVYLKGDWTRQDREITQFLRAHGRDGVPLYVFYPSGGGQPVVLPQLLTPGIVLGALAQATT